MADSPFLCPECPGKGNAGVDFSVNGSCPTQVVDSFRQARRYKLESPQDYSSDEEIIEITAGGIRYYDPDEDDFYEPPGDEEGARLGVECANTFLAGRCTKSWAQLILESEVD